MPLLISDHNMGHMTDREILFIVAHQYATPHNWEPFEKDTGAGFADIRPWTDRDKGDYARRALEFISKRRGEKR